MTTTRRFAAVDFGTNSTRLLVAEVDDRGTTSTLDRRMRITRLGQGVDASRRLQDDAIERNVDAMREYRAAIDALGVERIRAVATSAARDASNRNVFFDRIEAVLGVRPELISGVEEARLSFAGATSGVDSSMAPAPVLVVDIGGGSTEFVFGTPGAQGGQNAEGLLSVDMGCVRITEQFLVSDPPAPEELAEAIAAVKDHLRDVEREIPAIRTARTMIGLAGTVSAMASVEQGLPEYDRERIHHFRLTRAAAEDVFRTLATESAELRRHNPGLEPGRVDVIVGGALVLVTILRFFEIGEVFVSESDILDGIVMSLASSSD